jgi:hypothetical protein
MIFAQVMQGRCGTSRLCVYNAFAPDLEPQTPNPLQVMQGSPLDIQTEQTGVKPVLHTLHR